MNDDKPKYHSKSEMRRVESMKEADDKPCPTCGRKKNGVKRRLDYEKVVDLYRQGQALLEKMEDRLIGQGYFAAMNGGFFNEWLAEIAKFRESGSKG